MNANNFLKYCMGIALVCGTLLFGSAALIYTTTPATADAPTTTYNSGKYMMSLQAETGQSGNMNWYILVWNTESGRSKFYYGSNKMGKIIAAGSSYNLPSSPL